MILHRDIKPENVLISENHILKLGDFGLSRVIASHELASSYVGTWHYMASEVLNGEMYSHHSDIWSLGCVMYEVASRCLPFHANGPTDLARKVKTAVLEPLPGYYTKNSDVTSGPCHDGFVTLCLRLDGAAPTGHVGTPPRTRCAAPGWGTWAQLKTVMLNTLGSAEERQQRA